MAPSKPTEFSRITISMIRGAVLVNFRAAAGGKEMIKVVAFSRCLTGRPTPRRGRCTEERRAAGQEGAWSPIAAAPVAVRWSVPGGAGRAVPEPRSGQVSGVRCQAESGLSTRRKCVARAHEDHRTPEVENDHDGRGCRS